MKRNLILLTIILFSNVAFAQQMPQFTNYQLNTYMYNPAVAGVDGYTQMSANIRHQWVGVQEAPTTNAITMFGPMRNNKMALGGMVYSDKLGPESRSGFSMSYSYHLRLKDDISMSLGLSAGLLQYKIDNTSINPYDDSDPVFNAPGITNAVPNASFGVFLYSNKFHFSLAVPQLLNSSFNLKDDYTDEDLLTGGLVSHYYVSGGYKHDINSDFTLEPSLLIKIVSPANPQFEITCKTSYKKMFWSAVSYRLQDAATIYLGYDVNDQLYVAYGHDFLTSGLSAVSSGTNEFKLGYRFFK